MRTTAQLRRLVLLGLLGLGVAPLIATGPLTAHADATFAVGVPTIVDPIRAAGEPDIVVDNFNNALITGPGGSGTQTSWFWRSRDGGLTYPMLGPSGGHWVCPNGSGGGDSLGVIDRPTNDLYLSDQEALADVGFGKLTTNNTLTSACANAPAVTADRPFEAVLPTGNSASPQQAADGNKAIVYLSYACQGCGPTAPNGPGGLAFGWTDDGVTYHPAEPGATVPNNNLGANNFNEATSINSFQWHGPMVADPRTGDVFTALSCNNGNGCPNNSGRNEIGLVVGKPFANPATDSAGNIGQFQTLTYQTAALPSDEGSLFPVITMDSNYTLYIMWVQGNGTASTSTTPPTSDWHIYYEYSLDSATDNHSHTVWSAPIQVDAGGQTSTSPTSAFGWAVAGDAGKVGFIWLQTNQLDASNHREHPSLSDVNKQWHAYMAVTTNGDTAAPTFQQAQVGIGPNHIKDICLQGTVGCITSVGNRNMADFISVDIGPNGQLQGTWANDSNQLATQPTTLIPGLPITETAVQVSGPRLIGSGDVSDARFSTAPTTTGIGDATGDALFPVQGGSNVAQLDLTGSRIAWDGTNLLVHISAADLSSMNSPDATHGHVWWLTTWQFNHQIYFARAEWDSLPTSSVACAAGVPRTFDRPGLNAQTVATLADYSGGTTVACTKTGNEFVITVPPSVVGGPGNGSVLEATTGFTALDNGLALAVGPGPGNIPTVTDATPAYDAVLSTAAVTPEAPLTVLLPLAAGAVAVAAYARRRRRASAA